MPLTMANIGEVNEIKRIGGNEETRRFLANLGFVAGAEITVVSAIGGNVIVTINDGSAAYIFCITKLKGKEIRQ